VSSVCSSTDFSTYSHDFRAEALGPIGIGLVGGLFQPLIDIVLGNAFLVGPFDDRQIEVENGGFTCFRPFDIPLLGIGLFRDVGGDHFFDDLVAHLAHRSRREAVLFHQFLALLEDHLALIVHHVIVFQQVLADVEVARLDLLLGLFQRLVDPRMDDRLAFLQAELLQHAIHPVGAEDAHQIVLKRQEEFRAARVALTAGTAAQLVVDAAAFVALGGQHVKSAGIQRLLSSAFDIGSRSACALASSSPVGHVAQLGERCAYRHCRRAECRCRGRPCWWRW
jgi:hypothetical protein